MDDNRTNEWPRRHRSRVGDFEPGDEVAGAFPRDLLIKMDARFCKRLTAEIASGRENPPVKSERPDSRW
jgi:hypothetical protein